ncbi:peptidase U35 [Desulfosarcina ovata subsp. sediminis]|uniref:Peptidase U35 n=1 Tax=Desulfosarcina ovata subsp. sediminis TaxID=885957 RepID=A0A5K8A059_9BACT|nr:HK97 family phage prohead protease [Desulfosarcina ovata]BBO85907.1 peptidase U35 [Desulfosarcina ovata subsp. sediminis]
MKKIERRVFPARELRVRRSASGGATLAGYSAVFNRPSENLGWGDTEIREFIAPGAFTQALQNSNCVAVFNHDPNFVLGRESAGTLRLRQDDHGLLATISLPETQLGRDLAVSVERGDIAGQSFCFTVARDKWTRNKENGAATRTILEIGELIDVGPVTYPAYPDTDIARRSFERFIRSGNTGHRLKHFNHRKNYLKSKRMIIK